MITRATIRRFKALRDVSVDLAPFTVFAGPNGSGKTSLLRALQMMHDLRFVSVRDLFVRWNDPLHLLTRGAHWPIEFELQGKWGDQAGALSLQVFEVIQDESKDWGVKCKWSVRGPQDAESESDQSTLSGFAPAFAARMPHSVLLQLEVRAIAAAAVPEGPSPVLRYNGANLGAILADMKLTRPETFQELQSALIQVVPSVQQVKLKSELVEKLERLEVKAADGRAVTSEVPTKIWGHRVYFDFAGAPDVPAFEVSEGTLLVLAMLSTMVGPAQPRLVLLDDLARGLHPLAQGNLIRELRGLQKRDPTLQIVASTHSPYLLDHFRAEEICLLSTSPDGSAHCATLAEHPEYDRWREAMASGEFWSTVGEKWVTQRAAKHD